MSDLFLFILHEIIFSSHATSLGGSFDSRSSAANISLSNSSNLHPSNLETSALDQINSLLLGKVTPKTKNQSKASGDCECNFAQRDIGDSWVEISLNPDDSEEERSCDGDVLGRVNHVLNGGVDMTGQFRFVLFIIVYLSLLTTW